MTDAWERDPSYASYRAQPKLGMEVGVIVKVDSDLRIKQFLLVHGAGTWFRNAFRGCGFSLNGDSKGNAIGNFNLFEQINLLREHGSDLNSQNMRKCPFTPAPPDARFERDHPIDLSTVAIVEVTSEEKDHPVEAALIPGESKGWRASEPGTQTIRLTFDRPQELKRICLVFEEKETSRTQEFVLRWSPNPEGSLREIVRQQWNFSPPHTTTEVEEYRVDLRDVTILEMTITPDMAAGAARASISRLAVY
jgi:hypothetical protein